MRRSGPVAVASRPATGALGATLTAATSSRRAVTGALRRGPAAAVGGEAVRGSRRARRADAQKGASEAAAHNGEFPGDPGRLYQVIPAALLPPSVARACSVTRSWPSGQARRRCALEAVERVVTTRYWTGWTGALGA